MTLPPKFSGDLADLPTHGFGHRSLTWWGVLAFFAIEGAAFVAEVPVLHRPKVFDLAKDPIRLTVRAGEKTMESPLAID